MKKLIVLMIAVLIGAVTMGAFEPTSLVALATAPVVLDTQQIVFIRSLKEEYEKIDTWLNEAEDLSSFVIDGQTLRFPEGGADPAVYKNRTEDVDSVEPTETIHDVSLDYYDSQNYKMRNINLHALPFDKISFYTRKSANAIRKKEIADAAYAFAPMESGNKKIILPTTGNARNGYKMATLEDIITLARACDNASFPDDGRNLVLPSDMWWDLVQNNDILKAQLSYQQHTGIINPSIVNYYGFKIHKSTDNSVIPYDLTNSEKADQGTVITDNIVPAGFVFVKSQVFKADGSFDMYRVVKSQNTAGRAEEFGFSHRFKADFQMSAQRYSALLYQDVIAG